jgi:hypothetical protein
MLLETLNNNNVRTAEKLRQSVIGVLNTDAVSYNLSTNEGLNAYFESGHAAESKISKQDVQTLLREDTPQFTSVHTKNILKVQPVYKAQGNVVPLNRSVPRGNPEKIYIANDVGNIPYMDGEVLYNLSTAEGLNVYLESGHTAESKISKQDVQTLLREDTPQLASVHTENILKGQSGYNKDQRGAAPLNLSMPRGSPEMINITNEIRNVPYMDGAASYNLSADEGLNAYFESGHAGEKKISKKELNETVKEGLKAVKAAPVGESSIAKVETKYKDMGMVTSLTSRATPLGFSEKIWRASSSPPERTGAGGSEDNVFPLETVTLKSGGSYNADKAVMHYGHNADEMARKLGVMAFAVGNEVFFRDGKYKPETEEGRKLIAHELAHVRQYEEGRVNKSADFAELEREADAAGKREEYDPDPRVPYKVGENETYALRGKEIAVAEEVAKRGMDEWVREQGIARDGEEYLKILCDYKEWLGGRENERFEEEKLRQVRKAVKAVTRGRVEEGIRFTARDAEEAWERAVNDRETDNKVRVSGAERRKEKTVLAEGRGVFPFFDIIDFPNPLEMFLFLIDPFGKHIRQVRNSFPMMSASEQMDYLQIKHLEGIKKIGCDRGRVAKHIRDLRSQMKLKELFKINDKFMNIKLREFLNINENGVDYYTWDEVNKSPWREVSSLGCIYHQLTAPNTKVLISIPIQPYNQLIYLPFYNRLNAKFCHPDGREAIFSYKNENEGVYVTDVYDKATYNYGDDNNDFVLGITSILPFAHNKYDIKQFENYINEIMNRPDDDPEKAYIKKLKEENKGKCNVFPFMGNSKFWFLTRDN